MALSPDGLLALSGSQDGTVRLWDVNTGQELRSLLKQEWWVVSVAFSPDGRTAAAGTGGLQGVKSYGVWLFDVPTMRVIDTGYHHRGYVFGLTFFPDSKYLLSGGGDRQVFQWGQRTRSTLKGFTTLGSSATTQTC